MSDAVTTIARYRWTKRGLAIVFILLGTALVTRLAVGYAAESRYDASFQSVRHAGYPVDYEDFHFEMVPDKDNRVWHYKQAEASLPTVGNMLLIDTDWYWEGGRWALPEEQVYTDPVTDNAAYLKQFEPTLGFLEAMSNASQTSRPELQKPYDPNATYWNNLDYAGEIRAFARTLEDAAWRAADLEDYELAFRLCRHILELESLCDFPSAGSFDARIALGLRAMTNYNIELLLSSIKNNRAMTPAARHSAQRLIACLLKQDLLKAMLDRGHVHDHYRELTDIQLVQNHMLSYGDLMGAEHWESLTEYEAIHWLVSPIIEVDAARLVGHRTDLLNDLLAAGTYSQSNDAINRHIDALGVYEPAYEIQWYLRPWTGEWYSPLRTVQIHYSCMADSRMAAVAIAIMLYESDNGRRPIKLDELVPTYIAEIPDDPYLNDGSKVGYVPEGVKGLLGWGYYSSPTEEELAEQQESILALPVLYCVGQDLKDDGGRYALEYDGTIEENYYSNADDIPIDKVFMLAPYPEPYLEDSNDW